MDQESKFVAPGPTPAEYARQQGVSIDWIYRLIRTGKLPHTKVLGRVFILAEEQDRELATA
jgi:excisionase family DNA binding protein